MPDYKYIDSPYGKTQRVGKVVIPHIPMNEAANVPLKYRYDVERDAGLRLGMNQEWNRADNQAWYDQVYQGFLSRGLSIGTKVGQGIGALYGAGSAIANGEISKIWDNPLFNMFAQADESLKDMFPVYQSKEYQQGDLLGKMGTSTFWTTDFFDGLAFAASAYAPGKLIGAITKGISGGLNSTKAGASLLKSMRGVGMSAHKADLVAATAYNTLAEAAVEAYQTKEEVQAIYQAQGLSEDVAKEKAAKAAAETFWWNAGILAVPNYIQNSFFHGGWANRKKAVHDHVWANKGSAEKISMLKNIWGNVKTGIASEGLWEENIQNAVSNYEKQFAKGYTDDSMLGGVASNMLSNIKGFAKSFMPGVQTDKEENEAAMSIFLGSVIGGMFGVGAGINEYTTDKALATEEEGRYKHLFGDGGQAAMNLFVENKGSLHTKSGTQKVKIAEDQEIEVPVYETDDNAKLKFNQKALVNKIINELRDSKFWDVAILAAYNNDPVMDTINDEMMLAAYAHDLASNPHNYSKEELNQYLDQLGNIGTEEAKALGVDSFIKDNVESVKKYIQKLEDLENKHNAAKDIENPAEQEFKNFIKIVEYYFETKSAALDKVLPLLTKPEAIEAHAALKADTAEALRQISQELDDVRKEYDSRIGLKTKLVRRYNELKTKANKTAEESKEFDGLEFLNAETLTINGAYEWKDNAASGFGVITPMRVQTKVAPGTRDQVALGLGREALALDDIRTGLQNGTDSLSVLADKFIDNVISDTPETQEVQTALLDKLAAEEQSFEKENENIENENNAIATLEAIAGQGESVSLAEIAADLQTPLDSLLAKLVNRGITINPTDEITPEDFDNLLPYLQSIVEENLLATKQNEAAQRAISERRGKVAYIDTGKFDSFKNASDKEKFLRQQFLDTVLSEAEYVINTFRKDPDNFRDSGSISRALRSLSSAIAAYESRTDITDSERASTLKKLQDLYDIIANEIAPEVMRALEKQGAKQAQSNLDAISNSLFVLGFDGNDKDEIQILLKEILGEERYKSLGEAYANLQSSESYDGIGLILDTVKKVATPEQLKKLEELLDKQLDGVIAELVKTIPNADSVKSLIGKANYYKNIPSVVFHLLIKNIFADQANNPNSRIFKYLQDHDLEDLVANRENDKTLNHSEKSLLFKLRRLHYKVIYNKSIANHLFNSTADHSQLVAVKEKLFEITKPSLQQNIILTDIFRFLFSKTKGLVKNSYNNWFIFKGIGGSGKTFLVSKVATSILELVTGKPIKDNVYAFSHTEETSKNVNEAIFGKIPVKSSYENFLQLTDAELSKLDLIVLDEIFAFSNSQIDEIQAKLVLHQTATDHAIKVIAMGDPSQVVAEDNPKTLSIDVWSSYHTIPLTTNFRTNIGAINGFIDNYRLASHDVSNIPAQANLSKEEIALDSSKGFGTLAATEDEIIDILSRPSARSRVLIVPTYNDVERFRGRVNVPVRTPAQVQGFQWDEVYIIGTKPAFGNNNIEVNRALYTAGSRAKALLVVDTNLNPLPVAPEPSITTNIEQSGEELKLLSQMYSVSVEHTKEVSKILSGVVPITKQEVITPPIKEESVEDEEGETIYSDAISQQFSRHAEYDALENTPPVPIQPLIQETPEAIHSLAYPTNYTLGKDSPIAINSEAHIVRYTDSNKDTYFVVTPSTKNPNLFIVVGALSDHDFKNEITGNYFSEVIKNKSGKYIQGSPEQNIFGNAIPNINDVSLGKVFIRHFNPLKSNYSNEYVYGVDVIDDAIIKFYNTFFGLDNSGRVIKTHEATISPEKDWVVNGKVNWNILRNKVSVHIFSRNKPAPGWARFGVPYLVINDPRQANGKDVATAMYIRMEPTKFSTRSKYYQPLRRFTELISLLRENYPELSLGSFGLHELVNQYAKTNFEVYEATTNLKGNKEEKMSLRKRNDPSFSTNDPQLDAILDELVPLGFGAQLKAKYFTDEAQAKALVGTELNGYKIIEYVNTSKDPNKFRGILKYKADIDSNIVETYQEWIITTSRGPAQVAFNNLAKANSHVGPLNIRITASEEGDIVKKFTRGRSLFGNFDLEGNQKQDAIDWDEFYAEIGEQLNLDRAKIESKPLKDRYGYLINHILKYHSGRSVWTSFGEITITTKESIQEILQDFFIKPVDFITLAAIVGDEYFDEAGYHRAPNGEGGTVSLREPLNMNMVNWMGTTDGSATKHLNPNAMNEENRADLNQLLSHAFTGMTKTSVVLGIPDVTKEPEPPQPKVETIGNVFDSIKGIRTKLYTNLIKILNNDLVRNIKVVYVDNIGGSTDLLKSSYNKKTGEVIVYSTKKFDTINNDVHLLSLFLHEVIHAATLGAIYRAKTNKGANAAEADKKFYSRVKAIHKRFNAHVRLTLKEPLEDYYQSSPDKKDAAEFIANLSNPKFHKLASKMTVGDKLKSLLSDLVDAILEFFGIKPVLSYYDLAFQTLREFIESSTVSQVEIFDPTKTIEEVNALSKKFIKTVNNEIEDLKQKIQEAEDEGDDNRADILKSKLKDISKSSVYDFKNKKLLDSFEALDPIAQLDLLRQEASVLGIDTETRGAFYNTNPVKTIASPGNILTTLNVSSSINNQFGDIPKNVRFSLQSIIQEQILNPDSNLLKDLLHIGSTVEDLSTLYTSGIESSMSYDDRLKLVSLFYNELFDYNDRNVIKRKYNIIDDLSMIDFLVNNFETVEEVRAFADTALIANINKGALNNLVADTIDNNLNRYKQARDFILNEVYENLNRSEGRLLTKMEVFKLIESKVDKDSNYLKELRIQLKELHQKRLELIESYSKEDVAEYKRLISRDIPNLEAKIQGLSALGMVNNRTGRKTLADVLEDIYPKNQWGDSNDISLITEDLEYVINDRGDRELVESANINEYIRDYSKSKEMSLSESLKDFLSFVRDPNNPGKFLNSGLVYIKTLQLLMSLDNDLSNTTDDTKGIRYVLKQLRALEKSSHSLSETDRAIIGNIKNLIGAALATQASVGGEALSNNIGIVSKTTPSGRVLYAAVYSKTTNVSNITYEEAELLTDVEISNASEDSEYLHSWLQSKQGLLPNATYNALFKKAEAANALRELYNNMMSMKETELYIATRSSKKGSRFILQRSKASGISFGIKEDLKAALKDLHYRKSPGMDTDMLSNFKKSFDKKKYNALSNGASAEKAEAIKYFFRQLLPAGLVEDLSIDDDNLAKLSQDVKFFIDRTEYKIRWFDDASTDADLVETEDSTKKTNTKEFSNVDDWLKDEVDNYLTKFSNLITKSTNMVRNVSVRDSKGGKFYKIHDSTYFDDVLNTLINIKPSEHFSGTEGTNKFLGVPKFLQTDYYANNIFVNGMNKILDKGEHEAMLNLDNNSVTPLTRENMFWFYHREFIQGFLSGADQFNGDSYWAYTYPPSEKPKHPMVRIKILPNEGGFTYSAEEGTKSTGASVKDAIREAITQIERKQNTSSTVKNYNNSLEDKNLYRNFELLYTAKKNLPNATTDELVNEVFRLMEEEASRILDELLKLELTFDSNSYKIFNTLKTKIGHNTTYNIKEPFRSKTGSGRNRTYIVSKQDILPVFDLFFKNHYINNYFLNQLFTGDYSFYSSPADMIKRMAGTLAPGIRPLIDPEIGMRETFNTLILDDTNVSKEEQSNRLRKLLFGDNTPTEAQEKEFNELMDYFSSKGYDMTDGQGFITPARYVELARGFGRAWGMGKVMKPVYFDIQPDIQNGYSTAKPTYIKYSTVTLEDGLVNRFPLLAELRRKMNLLGVDELTFESSVKVGSNLVSDTNNQPTSIKFNDLINMSDEEALNIKQYPVSPILTLRNHNYRLQLNAASDPNKLIPIFSQLMYFLNINEKDPTNTEAAETAYRMVAELISLGKKEFLEKVNSPTKLRSFLRKRFDGPGAQRALDLLQSGLSLNHPLLEKKAVIALASGMEASTVKIKFPGGKLVLQTAEGARMLDQETQSLAEELQYKRGKINGVEVFYAEVIMPQSMLTPEQVEAIKTGKELFVYGDGMGFRIPSTELHSALPLKVVGVYSTKEDTNVIIAPKDVVAIHGSDFDVDALMVITRELFTSKNNSFTSAEAIGQLFVDYKDLQEAIVAASNELTDPADIAILKDIFDKQSRRTRLLFESESSALSDEDQQVFTTDTEIEFNKWISNPSNGVFHKQNPLYNDRKARSQFGQLIGASFSKTQGWVKIDDSIIGALRDMSEGIATAMEENKELVAKSANLKNLIKKAKSLGDKVKKLQNDQLLAEPTSPIGYYKNSSGIYLFDPSFLEKINKNILDLQRLSTQIPTDFSKVFVKKIKVEVDKLLEVKTAFLRNSITETMLRTISDPENLLRMTTPITFKPIKDAIDSIPKDLLPGKNMDLSNISHKQEAYSSLGAGQVLVGAFANAVKVLAYLLRAGSSNEISSSLDDLALLEIRATKVKINKDSGNLTQEDFNKEFDKLLEEHKKGTLLLKEKILGYDPTVPTDKINSRNQFSLVINSKLHTFKDINLKNINNLSTTQVFDTLINSAIDNLKLGYLGQARINTLSGSAVVGLTALGVPLETSVQLFYQPIFNDLFTGRVNNIQEWFTETRKKYKEQLDLLEGSLSDKDLKAGLLSTTVDNNQLKAFQIFEKAYKVGEDIRNLSDFMGIVRQMPVFIEDIDGVFSDLKNKIGTIIEVEDEMLLIPRKDFSFNIPFVFKHNPHIKEAYKTLVALKDSISDSIELHSEEVREFTKLAYEHTNLSNTDEEDSVDANLAAMRRNLVAYFLSNSVWDKVEQTPNIKYKLPNTQMEITLSKARSFSENTARKLEKLRTFVNSSSTKNEFLRYAIVTTNEFNTKVIRFKGGVNQNPVDIEEITQGFKDLNQYTFDEKGNVVLNDALPNQLTSFQEDLLTYAILNFGLQFSSSNYSNFIPATMFKATSELLDTQIRQLSRLVDSGNLEALKSKAEHFRLAYVLMNGDRLPFVTREESIPTRVVFDQDGNKSSIYNGREVIEGEVLYFDRKIRFEKLDPDRAVVYPPYIKTSYDNRVVVYKLTKVYKEEGYYQQVGKTSEVFYSPMTDPEYRIAKYYNPNELTIPYSEINSNERIVGTKLSFTSTTYPADEEGKIFLTEQDSFWIVPSYNADRTLRVKVKLVGKPTAVKGKHAYKYTVEVVSVQELTVEQQILNQIEEDQKNCKI